MNNIEYSSIEIAVLIPCYNENKTIVKVIEDFKRELPDANILVFENNSTDGSYDLAVDAGAKVIKEKRQGKGFVLSSMFNDVVADIYVLVDGDDTYPAENVHELILPVLKGEADMTVGQRLSHFTKNAFRPIHYEGNRLVCNLINMIFSSDLKDPMSGYRVFNRKVVMEIPIVATGFDVETEMTLQMLYRHFKIMEIEIPYRERPKGSYSKLHTFKDGSKVIYKILSILQSYKPLTFFGGIGLILVLLGMFVGSLVIREYMIYQYIFSVPKAILSTGLISIGVLSSTVGIILHTLNFRLLELSSNNAKMFALLNSYRLSGKVHKFKDE